MNDHLFREFAATGYVVLPSIVGEEHLRAVDEEIDELIARDPPPSTATGHHFSFLPPGQLPAADAALTRSGALEAARAFVAPRELNHAFDHIQVALNIPPHPHRPGGPHLDGHRPEQKRPESFTMLAAVYLSDESEPDSGNLWVWPGSHLIHQELFRQRGPHALLPVSGHTLSLADPPTLSEPLPVLARRGDVLLAHFLLGHNIGGNLTGRTRRIVYYRLSCPGHTDRWAETFLDPFFEYEPVAALAR